MGKAKPATVAGKLALSGRVVCLDQALSVIDHGTVYINGANIVAVQNAAESPPVGFEQVAVVKTGGTLYPGLIELHNHISYNVLQLWQVPKKFSNRDQWSGIAQYHQLVTGPMKVLAQSPGILPAIVRLVETKCLVAGVTSSQGIALSSSNNRIRRFYKGSIRPVEQPDTADLPAAASHIADVATSDSGKFLTELRKCSCLLLHLSEGKDAAARNHFLSLHLSNGAWAITDALAGIHCAALTADDFKVLRDHGGSMVWSPLSNMLLYGATADVAAAKAADVRMALGSDWSPSGSKNLLGELKVARLFSRQNGGLFTDSDLVRMVTSNAAAILKWDKRVGSIEAGKYADLVVIDGSAGDPYATLIEATEASVQLVMIGGAPRFGAAAVMNTLGASGERVRISGSDHVLSLDGTAEDPDVAKISLAQARESLTGVLSDLSGFASRTQAELARAKAVSGGRPVFTLALDELEDTGFEMRPHLAIPKTAETTGATRPTAAPVPTVLPKLTLDALSVVDDPGFFTTLAAEKNLPAYLAPGLKGMYS
jgi:cytosine/adenosine deaminase-related metal-dependent hydrolase